MRDPVRCRRKWREIKGEGMEGWTWRPGLQRVRGQGRRIEAYGGWTSSESEDSKRRG